MALIETDLFGNRRDKVHTAINRIRAFCPPEGYYLAFSGGKDSVVIKALCDKAGVKYDAHYNATTVDPPELVRFIRQHYPDVVIEKPEYSMRQLIIKKKIPPSRIQRYCCEHLKERNGVGRITMTGVRWAESSGRKANRGLVDFPGTKVIAEAERFGADYEMNAKGSVILNSDNDAARKLVETCYAKHNTVVNPIVDWTDADVWEFIGSNSIPYCSLYDEGFKRLGCVGCPLGGYASMKRELTRWPAIRKMYVLAFDEMIEARRASGLRIDRSWTDGEGVLRWWCGEIVKSEGQMEMEFEGGETP